MARLWSGLSGWLAAAFLAVASLSAPVTADAQQPAQVIRSTHGFFNQPSGIVVDGQGNIFVVDGLLNQVFEIKPPNYVGAMPIGSPLVHPIGIALDAAGNLFVADAGASLVEEFLVSSNYASSTTLASGMPGATGITIDKNGDLYVTSPSTGQIFFIIPSAPTPAPIAVGLGLVNPTGIAVDSNLDLFVTDPGDISNQVKELPHTSIPQKYDTPVTLSQTGATLIAADSGGDVFYGVPGSGGVFETTATGTTVQRMDNLLTPYGVAVDTLGNLYVTDQGNKTVVELEAATTTAVVAAPSPSIFGASVTLTATVTVSAGTPTGTVTFFDGASPLATVQLIGNGAALATSSLTAGSHSITAAYNGDVDYGPSTSAVTTEVINPADTLTTLAASPNPSEPGQFVTFTATVTGTGVDGTVTFFDGSTPLGTIPVTAGQASFSTASLSTGDHLISANYSGSTDFEASSGALTQSVALTANMASTTSVISSADPSAAGQSVTFTAFVSSTGGIPTGTVIFKDGTTVLGSGGLTAGTASFSTAALAIGDHSITASYGGDSTFTASTSALLTQSVGQSATTTSLISSVDPSAAGQSVIFTASVTGTNGTPTGTVTFKDGTAVLGSGTLTGGTVSFSTATLALGSHAITASYGGDGTFIASSSTALTQTIVQASSRTALSAAPNPSSAGQTVTFTALVSGNGGSATGTVTFTDGATPLGTASLAAGQASIATATLAVGPHSITARYSGDGTFGSSLSATLTEIVTGDSVAGQAYGYQNTLGTTGVAGLDNAHFASPVPGAVDTANGHLFIADTGNHRVQVIDTGTLAVVATIGVAGTRGADNAHFDQPRGVGLDPASGRVFVADAGNDRIQIFDLKSFTYLATLGVTGTALGDNGHFSLPSSAQVNPATGQLYVADRGNQRVQIFDTASLAYVATLGVAGAAGSDTAHLSQPGDAVVDPSTNQILVADTGNLRLQVFDAASFAYVSTLGATGIAGSDNGHFTQPGTIGFDPASNLLLVTDAGANARVQVFDALTYAYVLTLGSVGSGGPADTQFALPEGVAADPAHSRLFIGDGTNDRVQVFAIAPVVTLASVLPGSRSVQLGHPATIFASVLNAGATALADCRIALPVTAPSGLTLSYQTTDPATNTLTGTPNAPVLIPGANGVQSFLISFQGTNAFTASALPLDFDCSGAAPAAVVPGVDTIDLTLSSNPVADIIALAATPTGNGILQIPLNGAAAFAVASANAGATAPITVSIDTGSATLPLSATLCQSNPGTGQCLAPPSTSVALDYAAGATPTFSVFLQSTGVIPFAPAASRAFIRFKDASSGLHGSTSVAVETQ